MSQTESSIALTIEDNGIGLPEDFVLEQSKSLGATLIQTLTNQLQGELSLEDKENSKGTRVSICFSKDN